MTLPRSAVAITLGVLVTIACTASNEEPLLFVLLTVDTLRADHLGAYGSEHGLTPHLDGLAGRSLVFEAAYAPTPFTVPSLVSLHTGRHPLALGLRTNSSLLTDSVETLAERFASRGWDTAAVVSNYVLQDRDDLSQGFARYDDTMRQREAVRRWPERIAGDTTDAAIAELEAWRRDASTPLFLWVHYQDPHGPYTPPAGWRERFLPAARRRYGDLRLPGADVHGHGGIPRYQALDDRGEAAFYAASYAGEIAYLDQEIGRLLQHLAGRGLDERLVFAADHGEAMGENDLWFAHGNDLTDGLIRVPLFVRLPQAGTGRRGDVVRLADLYPTLASALLDLSPAPDLDARDLLAPDAERSDSVPLLTTLRVHREPRFGIVADGYKLILTLRDGIWAPRLYRRAREDVDLAAAAPQLATRLRDRAWELREQRDSGEQAPFQPLDPERIRNLEALGYVGESPE